MGVLDWFLLTITLAFTVMVIVALVGFVWQLFSSSKPNRRHKW